MFKCIYVAMHSNEYIEINFSCISSCNSGGMVKGGLGM